MTYALETHNLTKNLSGRDIVSDVNIRVKKGEIYGFLGPNGAGKTSIMKMITNLWKPTSGYITVMGKPLNDNSYDILKRMGSMIEYPTFYDGLDVYKRQIHRYVQPGQSLLIGRPAGKYHELDKENVDWDSFDHTPRQQPKKPDPAKAKETMRDLWGTFTEEQVKKETERCLGCGATVVDQNVCVGCGICSTKCKFDALHLERRYDAHEVPYEKLIVNHMAPTLMKRGAKIAARKAKDITLSRKRRQN